MQIASRQCLWRDTAGRVGTMLAVEATSASMTAYLSKGVLAEGSKSVTVYWGDGGRNEYAGISGATHTYANPGEYVVTISDDLASFGYTDYTGSTAQRNMLRELLALGSKVTMIEGYGFNNCKMMRGVIELPNVTTIDGYAFGSTEGVTDFILPSMTRLVQTSFYCGPSPTQIHADNATRIDQWFWDFYGPHLRDIYLRASTCKRILAMGGFPFRAPASARFHGSDGIVLGNRTVVND